MINLCVPTIKRYDLLSNLIESAEAGTVVPDNYIIVDNGAKINKDDSFRKRLEKSDLPKDKIKIIECRWSVAQSWNFFIKQYDEHLIISNDDIELLPQSIETLINEVDSNPETLMFSSGQNNVNAFSFFLIRKKLIELVGQFDEHFRPAYFEDCDFHRRMEINNIKRLNVQNLQLIHHHSATAKSYNSEERKRFQKDFMRNMMYYIKKWGGRPEQEQFSTPFNVARKI
jgi:hypothetical protein